MILIGLHGPARCGKDTAFASIERWASERSVLAVRRGFADTLKLSAYRIFKPDATLSEALEWADWFKLHGGVVGWEHADGKLVDKTHNDFSGREYLQRYGTEAHRDVFGPDFWVDQLLPFDELTRLRAITQFLEHNKLPAICVITDVRFENEAERIHKIAFKDEDWFGNVVRIERPSLEQNDEHISEKPLPERLLDQTLINDGTLEDFDNMVGNYLDDHISSQLELLTA